MGNTVCSFCEKASAHLKYVHFLVYILYFNKKREEELCVCFVFESS